MDDYVVSIGTICIDDNIACNEWPNLGDKALAETKGYLVGGMPYNSGCVIANSDVKTYMLDVIGDDFKDIIIEDLKKNNVDYSLCNYDNHETLRTIIVNVNGERVIFVLNANSKPEIILDDNQMDILINAKYVYTNIAEIKRIKNNKEIIKTLLDNDVKIVYDLESTAFDVSNDDYYFDNASVLSFNEKGYKKFIDGKPDDYIGYYIEKGIIIIITKGEHGCEVITKDIHENIDGHKVSPIDTTGAGDTFNATFVSEQIKGKSVLESVKRANKVAALSTEYFGVNKRIIKDIVD